MPQLAACSLQPAPPKQPTHCRQHTRSQTLDYRTPTTTTTRPNRQSAAQALPNKIPKAQEPADKGFAVCYVPVTSMRERVNPHHRSCVHSTGLTVLVPRVILFSKALQVLGVESRDGNSTNTQPTAIVAAATDAQEHTES